MGKARHLRFPEEMEALIEKGIELDRRRDFTDEVVYLVGLGLEEAALERADKERGKAERRGAHDKKDASSPERPRRTGS